MIKLSLGTASESAESRTRLNRRGLPATAESLSTEDGRHESPIALKLQVLLRNQRSDRRKVKDR
jgi:hypothetical protein